MKQIFLKLFQQVLILGALCAPAIALAQDPIVCDSQYALCTTAKCTSIPGDKEALCNCEVKTGDSAGFKACEAATKTSDGLEKIKSRYYPIKSYVSCANDRAWANCLDSPCVIDKENPSRALCTCTLVKHQGDYVIVTESCDKSGCESGITSSALVKDALSLTEFLKNQNKLPTATPTLCK